MNVAYLYSLIAVVVLGLIAYAGVEAAGLDVLFGVVIPYLALIVFLIGFANKVLDWTKSAVPFKIPTTFGQQKSLDWIKHNRFDSPYTTGQVVIRMLLEILLLRSLFKNTRVGFGKGQRIAYKWVVWLWLFAILFHYSFFVVVLRHLRFFAEPVPFFVSFLEKIDGMFQILLPNLFLSGVLLLGGALLLLLRRVLLPKLVYISKPADYFPLFLIIGIAVTGLMMRYLDKVDVVRVKELAMGLATLQPGIPEGGISGLFYVHLFFVSILVAYIPFSKIMHMGGVFLSPTRNLANNTRAKRHVNPWNYPVKTHTYEEYEEDFRDKMKEAGIPVEKE
ncbi:MAG: sulfate reduction electron transfer complex DsrMKJOP subunit DsrM [Desulfobacterales bacterium]|nr:sulfate reduction electron transfer complex DsrMKJOP subunit DsrM [Desulfobacterales bacterium]MBS3756064.1 sulfate reduction electron transfer complex DsrMKJOP subunit DsrM [Desulfobacterales bacterium]